MWCTTTKPSSVAYWAEGAKRKPWRPQHRTVFVNRDPDMIRLFLAFLHLIGIEHDRLVSRLAIHESPDLDLASKYWSKELDWPLAAFRRATLKRHMPGKQYRRNVGDGYHGCLSVSVLKSRDVHRRIEGMWAAVAQSAHRLDERSRVV